MCFRRGGPKLSRSWRDVSGSVVAVASAGQYMSGQAREKADMGGSVGDVRAVLVARSANSLPITPLCDFTLMRVR
jgi:hypothetical protein